MSVDALGLDPLPRDVGADVGLVLVVGEDDFDRPAQHLAAEILDRHARGVDRAHAGQIRVQSRLVVEDTELDRLLRDRGGGQPRSPQQERERGDNVATHENPPLAVATAECRSSWRDAYRGRASLQSGALAFAPAPCISAAWQRQAVVINRRIRPRAEAETRAPFSVANGPTGDIRKRSTREAAIPRLNRNEHDGETVAIDRPSCHQASPAIQKPETVSALALALYRRKICLASLPIIVGKVESVSRDRMVDEQTKQPYFLAQVVVDDIPSFVKDRLSAGMPADVIFPTGERTVLDYLVRPLKDRLRGVMREK